MRLRLVLCVAALLAACTPEPEAPGEEAPAPAAGAAVEKRMPLPDCEAVETQDQGADGWIHPDCRLMLTDASGLAIEARYTRAEDESTNVAVQVVAPGDATLQTIDETMGNTFNRISLQDIDGDGKTDLLVPLETGNVNTTWAVWRQLDNSFQRAGELSGVGISRTEDGHLAVPARSSASEWNVEFWRLEGGELLPVATAEVSASLSDTGEASDIKCDVVLDGRSGGVGLSAEEARTKFCAEPAAADVFK
jgi:hypothetical protein